MPFGEGRRATFLLLLANILQQGGSQINCKIEVDLNNGLWRETTPQPEELHGALYCKSYSYRVTNLNCTSTQCQSASIDGSCTLYFNVDTHLPCLATCRTTCSHGFPCYKTGNCSCTQKNARYDKAKMCVPYSKVKDCNNISKTDNTACPIPTCDDTCPNGQCDPTGTCVCISGFTPDSTTGKCVPNKCANACVGGTCQTYGSCTCPDGSVAGPEEGYMCPPVEADNETQIQTNNPCANVTCVHGICNHGKCTCNDGFVIDPKNELHCVPSNCPNQGHTDYCQRQCELSSCLNRNGGKCEQGECKCKNSFKKDPSDKYKCHQIVCPEPDPTDYCQRQCQNHGCTAERSGRCEQGECKCNEGFKKDPTNQYKCDRIVCPEWDSTNYCQRQCLQSGCKDHGRCLNSTCSCNQGYKQSPNNMHKCNQILCPSHVSEDKDYCKAQCGRSCKNGACDYGGTCICNEGYKQSPNYLYQCDPILCPSYVSGDKDYCKAECVKSCKNGACDYGGNCSCNEGYKQSPNYLYQCDPILCPSYVSGDKDYCKAECVKSCKNGACDYGGNCSCNKGYKKSPNYLYQCDPILCPSYVSGDKDYCKAECVKSCKNGACDYGGNCSCNKGYKKSPNNMYQCDQISCPSSGKDDLKYCGAQCSQHCHNGACSDDGACKCNDGYKMDTKALYKCNQILCPSSGKDDLKYCGAQCSQHCHNGACSDDGACKCNAGYKMDTKALYKCSQIKCPSKQEDDAYCKAKCNSSCMNGICDQVGRCECKVGFTKHPAKAYTCVTINCPSTASKVQEWAFCKTVCESQCDKGVCDEAGVCNCIEGFKKLQGTSYECSKIECPASVREDDTYCALHCNNTCTNGKCSETGACECDKGFVPINSKIMMDCHHECKEDGSCDLAAILGGIVGVGLAIIIAIIVTAVVMRRMMDRKEQAERKKGQTQDMSLDNVFKEPEYVNAGQEEEMEENSMYQSLEWYRERRRAP